MFVAKKKTILEQLELPVEDYHDSSPKGSIDGPIQGLIKEINAKPNLVTTSSCSGRISVYLEGERCKSSSKSASSGGKGGGKWLFVSHEPLDIAKPNCLLYSLFNLNSSQTQGASIPISATRFVHFKFEAMVRGVSIIGLEYPFTQNRFYTF
jgi:tRNA wybutosine-synthesizing protein 3